MQRRPILAIVAAVPLILSPNLGAASTWHLVTVAQPLFGEGYVAICDVPYGEGSFVPGTEIALTCEPNAIRMLGEELGGESTNQNAASRVGLTVDAGPAWNGRQFLDTLQVTLDAGRADSIAAVEGFAPDAIVAATVMCLRINAARAGLHGLKNKYLKLRILGPPRLRRFAAIYKLRPLSVPQRTYDLGAASE